MPKRMLDSSMLSSPSLAKCSPRAQDAWPRFLLLMDDFGCADANPRRLLGEGWPLRDDVNESDVWGWLEEYVAAGMACLWTEKERRWVYLTGWHGPHGQKARAEYDPNAPHGTPGRHGSKRKTPVPPADLVSAVVAGARRDADGKPPGVDRENDTGLINEITPARETTGNLAGSLVSRVFPAPAVPVQGAVQAAVPVAPIRSSIVPDHRGASPEEVFHSLFKLHPAWTAVRRCLTTEQAHSLDAAALQFCGAVVRGEEPPNRDRVTAIIQSHAARKAQA